MTKEALIELKERLKDLSKEEQTQRDFYLRRLSLGKKPIVAVKGFDDFGEYIGKLIIGEKLDNDILIDGKLEYKCGTLITEEMYNRLQHYLTVEKYDSVEDVIKKMGGNIDYSRVEAPILGPPVGFNSIDKPHLKNYTDEQIADNAPLISTYDYLYQENREHLNDVAFEYLTEKITYKELFKNIYRAAKAYKSIGVKKGDVVTICSITTPQIIYSFFALNRLGAVSNIIDVRYPEKAIEEFLIEEESKVCVILDLCYPNVKNIIERTKVEKVITVSPVESEPKIIRALAWLKGKKEGKNVKITDDNGKYINWKEFIKRGKRENLYGTNHEENMPAAIIHTGGTTGIPKGVRLTNENINNVVIQIKNANVDTKRGFKFLNIMPPFIAYGLSLGLVTPLVLGWRTRIVPKFEPEKFDELILKYRPNGFMGVHTYFEPLMKKIKDNTDLSFIKIVLCGGMKVPAEAKKRINLFLRSHGSKTEISEGYSCTEANSTATKTIDGDEVLDTAGIPLVKTTVAAFQPNTSDELEPGIPGELCIKSPTVMLDYSKHEEETKKVKLMHEDGNYWIHTGDIGYTDSEGRVYPTDRIKRLFPRSGFKVFPSRIENLFLSHPAVETCSIIRMPNEEEGHVPYAIIVLKDEYKGKEEYVTDELFDIFSASDLPQYFEPTKIIFTDALLYTTIGKVDYKKMEEILSTGLRDMIQEKQTAKGKMLVKRYDFGRSKQNVG